MICVKVSHISLSPVQIWISRTRIIWILVCSFTYGWHISPIISVVKFRCLHNDFYSNNISLTSVAEPADASTGKPCTQQLENPRALLLARDSTIAERYSLKLPGCFSSGLGTRLTQNMTDTSSNKEELQGTRLTQSMTDTSSNREELRESHWTLMTLSAYHLGFHTVTSS